MEPLALPAGLEARGPAADNYLFFDGTEVKLATLICLFISIY